MSVLALVPTILTAIYAGAIGLVVTLGIAHLVLLRVDTRAYAGGPSVMRGGGRYEVDSTARHRR